MSLQAARGTAAVPATADILNFLNCDLNPAFENLIRGDKGFGRSYFGDVQGGHETATFSIAAYLILAAAANPVVAPPIENLLIGALGPAPVSFADTVQASPSPTATAFAVTSAASLKAGDMVAVNVGGSFGYQMRPIASISTNTLTFSIPFGAAPSSGAAVIARIYRLSSAVNYFTLCNWQRDTGYNVLTTYSREAIDAVIGRLDIDMMQAIAQLSASGPASQVTEPGASMPALPTLPTVGTESAQANTFGEAFLDTTAVNAYAMRVSIDNMAKNLPAPLGSKFSDGTIFGMRKVTGDVTLDANSVNAAYLTDSEQKNAHALFAHLGNTNGNFFGINLPKVFLQYNDPDKSQETLRLNFTGSVAAATAADNELVIAIA